MILDPIDGVFLARWQSQSMRPLPAPDPGSEAGSAAADVAFAYDEHPAGPAAASAGPEPGPDADLLERLLAAAWPQWNTVADRVEAARGRGRRVVAVAGSEPGEGRTTLVEGLAQVLRGRGREVICTDAVALDSASACGAPHDKRVVLVDAGIWFPAGPIRRQLLAVATRGCDAAILTRRADRPAHAARETALAAIGVELLGEVVTFATPAPAPPRQRRAGDGGARR